MILLEEKKSIKLPTSTSIFITTAYNPKIVDVIKLANCSNFDKKTNVWEVPVNSLALLVNELAKYDDITIKVAKDVKKKEKEQISYKIGKYNYKPFDYQMDGIQYGLNHDKWLLLDCPGLGKTLQSSIIAKEIQKRDKIKHCLIICGINTLKYNWKAEIKKYTGEDAYILGQRTSRNGKEHIAGMKDKIDDLKNKKIDEFFIITNIETIRDKDIVKLINDNKKNPIDMVIVDEVHVCKRPDSQQGKGLLNIKSPKFKIAMTGTLLMNNPMDCYVPLKWIGAEQSTFTNFKYYYCRYGGLFNNELIGFQNLTDLQDQLAECSLRRTKDLLNLPPKTIINEVVDMSDTQAKFYQNIVQGEVSQVDLVHISTANLLGIVTRLRQATECPSILSSENIPSAKLDRCQDLVEQMISNNEKVVVFSTFKKPCQEMFERLKEYNPVICTGDTSDADIEVNKKKFMEDESCKVFIGTWSKMGTGVTLTSASNMVFLSTPWTDSVYLQAQDRIHRIGSTKPVFIYNLICKDSIDERVKEIVEDKAALASYIIDNEITEKGYDSLKKYITELQ